MAAKEADLQLAALLLVHGHRTETEAGQLIPQSTWDQLRAARWIVNASRYPGGDPEPFLTKGGKAELLARLRALLA